LAGLTSRSLAHSVINGDQARFGIFAERCRRIEFECRFESRRRAGKIPKTVHADPTKFEGGQRRA
jgi:hypothetical protein